MAALHHTTVLFGLLTALFSGTTDANATAANSDDVDWSLICRHGGTPQFTPALDTQSETPSPALFDRCRCTALWEGAYCDYIRCFDGRRVKKDVCRCNRGAIGANCLRAEHCTPHGRLRSAPVGVRSSTTKTSRSACLCEHGFVGELCERVTSCAHGGVPSSGGDVCLCPDAWTGARCTIASDGGGLLARLFDSLPPPILLLLAVSSLALIAGVICSLVYTTRRRRRRLHGKQLRNDTDDDDDGRFGHDDSEAPSVVIKNGGGVFHRLDEVSSSVDSSARSLLAPAVSDSADIARLTPPPAGFKQTPPAGQHQLRQRDALSGGGVANGGARATNGVAPRGSVVFTSKDGFYNNNKNKDANDDGAAMCIRSYRSEML